MDFRTFIRIISTRWKIVVATLVACVLGAVAITVVQTRTYESSATILMSFSGAVTINELYEATQTSQQRLSSYAEIAGGREVAQRAIEQLGIGENPDDLVENTKVTYTPESMVFTLTVADSDRYRAAALAGAMADQFASMVPGLEQRPVDQPVPEARASVVERPTVPTKAVSPVPLRNIGLGVLAGVLLAIALAMVRERTDRSLRDRAQLEEVSELPTLALLPAVNVKNNARPRLGADPVFDEGIRLLRSRLIAGGQGHAVLVTGPADGEGSTTTALNLALSLSEIGNRVLLVEGDRRQAVLAHLLGVASQAGLAGVLAHVGAAEGAAHPTTYPNLSVVAASAPEGAGPQFGGPALPEALGKFSADYDWVIVDGPPAMATADAGLLSAAAGTTVVVARAGLTTGEEITAALENLRAAGGHIAGVVFNGAPVSRRVMAATRAYQAKVGGEA